MLIHLVVWFRVPNSQNLLRFNPHVGELNLLALDKIVHLVDLSISVSIGEKESENLEIKMYELFGKYCPIVTIMNFNNANKITWYLIKKYFISLEYDIL